MAADEPPYLTVGTDVSAKYKGAFCEAKIKKVSRMVKCKVTFKNNQGTVVVTDDQLRGTLRVGAHVEAKHPEKNQYVEAVINKLLDYSQYTVVFDDGDETTLRRTSICLKSGRHFAESETLDQLPLTNPEHFGTPVMGSKSKRKRRSTINSTSIDDDSSDEEPPVKQLKPARERKKDPNFGKVVCYEIGDKRKKDSWLPCLVVSPTAQEHMKISTKEDYLIRSFKDGKYYQVPKKEVKEFTKEIGLKTESTTNKAAVDRAILYMERDELPANWEKNVLMGLDVPSADEDSQESESDTSDDEPSEEKDRFVAQLYKFMDERGTPINRAPTVGNRDLNLYKLFKIVHKMGGCNRVTNQNQWKTVHIKMGLPPPNSTSSNQIKSAYKRYLHSFEDFYRKLGCTMATTIRSSRARNRSERNFIMTRNRNRDIGTSKGRQDGKEKSLTQVLEEKIKMEEENREKANRASTVIKAAENEQAKPEDKVKEKEEGNRVRTREDKRREKADSPDKKEAKSSLKIESKDKEEEKVKKEPLKEKKEKNHKEKSDDKVSKEKRDEKPFKEKRDEKSFKEKKDEKPLKEKKDEKPLKEKKDEKPLKEKKDEKPLKEKEEKTKDKKDEKQAKERSNEKTLKEKKEEKLSKEKRDDKEKKDDKLPKEKKDEKPSKERKDDKTTKEKKDEKPIKEKKDEKPIKEKKDEKLSKDKKEEKSLKEKKDGKESNISDKNDNQSKIKNEDTSLQKKQIKKKTAPLSDKIQAEQKKSQESEQEHKDTNRDEEDIEMGDRVRVRYGRGRVHKIYEAKVIKIDKENGDRKFYVHYTGWNTRYDEWVKKGRIVENISERNVNARKKKLGLSLKNTNGKIPGKRGRPPSSAKLTPPIGNSVLVRKNSSSSISSTTSNSRTMRSDRNSLSESPFASGLEPRRRSRRKSGMSINNPEAPQELDSDLDHEESEVENAKESVQNDIKHETGDYKEIYEEQNNIQTLAKDECNVSGVVDGQKCLTDDDVEHKDILDTQEVEIEGKEEAAEPPTIKVEITEDADIKLEEDNLSSNHLMVDNSDEIKKELDDTVKVETLFLEEEESMITTTNNVADLTIIKMEEGKDETLIEELIEEHSCNVETSTEIEYMKNEINEIGSEETLDISLQETDIVDSIVICEEIDDKESLKVLEEVMEEVKVESTDIDTFHTDTTVAKSEELNEDEDMLSTNAQLKLADETPQESSIICEETNNLLPINVESDVANDDSQPNDSIPVISTESNAYALDDIKMEEIKCIKEDVNSDEIAEQKPVSDDLIEIVEEEKKVLCNEENIEEERTKQEMEEVSQIIADMAETETQIDIVKPKNQEIEDNSVDKPKLDTSIISKKETKKKKSKGMKIDKKSSGDNINREEGKSKDGKSKSKKKYKLENEDGEKCKEFEGKLKSKKLKEKDKKNKIKKRLDKSETCGENDTKQGDSKDELCEKLRKEKKKKEDKKSKSELVEGKTSDIKKEKKKGKKNKLASEKKDSNFEKKSKKKKKVHIEADSVESDSEKEGSSKVDGDKLKKKGKKKDKKKSKEAIPSEDADLKLQKDKKQEKKPKVEIVEETVTVLPESFSVPKVELEPEQDIAAFLFCEEKVPASPVGTEEPAMHSSHISQIEDLVANSTPAALAASEVLARISESVVNQTLTYPKGISHILVTEAANRHESEVAAVLDNTPPTTPESTESALYSSPLPERETYSLNDGESTHSGRESADGDSDNLHIETTKLDVAESEDSLVFPPLSSSVSNIETNKETCAKTSPTRKRHRDESEDFSQGKKKRKSSKKSHSSGISRKLSFSKSVKGETSLLENSSMDYRSITSPNYSLSTITQTSTPVDGSLPRPSKFNFYVSLDDYEDSNKRISAIQENLAQIRKVYMGLKAEVAIIDRRRKKAKRKEKEAAAQSSAAVSQPIEVQCSS